MHSLERHTINNHKVERHTINNHHVHKSPFTTAKESEKKQLAVELAISEMSAKIFDLLKNIKQG